MSEEREAAIKEANEMGLGELADKVIRDSFVPGCHDGVLIDRCREIEFSNEAADAIEKMLQWFRDDLGCGADAEGMIILMEHKVIEYAEQLRKGE